MPDVIGQTVANSMANPGNPDKCYDGRWQPKEQDVTTGRQRAEIALQAYLKLAASGSPPKPLFIGAKPWKLLVIDGSEFDVRSAYDPWAARVAKVEPAGFTVGNHPSGAYRALWNAKSSDGSALGTYEAHLLRSKDSARFLKLAFFSASAEKQPAPVKPFCFAPGDIETWTEVKAKRAADKAAKQAARENAR